MLLFPLTYGRNNAKEALSGSLMFLKDLQVKGLKKKEKEKEKENSQNWSSRGRDILAFSLTFN